MQNDTKNMNIGRKMNIYGSIIDETGISNGIKQRKVRQNDYKIQNNFTSKTKQEV